MSTEKPTTKTDAQQDMSTPYRPLGLKAVAAATLMTKRKPKLTKALVSAQERHD